MHEAECKHDCIKLRLSASRSIVKRIMADLYPRLSPKACVLPNDCYRPQPILWHDFRLATAKLNVGTGQTFAYCFSLHPFKQKTRLFSVLIEIPARLHTKTYFQPSRRKWRWMLGDRGNFVCMDIILMCFFSFLFFIYRELLLSP